MANEMVVIDMDDWVVVYVNGVRQTEGHELHWETALDIYIEGNCSEYYTLYIEDSHPLAAEAMKTGVTWETLEETGLSMDVIKKGGTLYGVEV